MKIKIIFLLPNLNVGGAERVAVNMLRQLDIKKFEATLILVKKTGNLIDLIPSNIEILDLNFRKTMFSILKLRRLISSLKPDIIFSTLFRTHIAVDLALTFVKKKPKLIYRSPNSPLPVLENRQLPFFMRLLLEKAYRNSDVVLAQTPQMKEEIRSYHGIDDNKISVLLNPLDKNFIDEKTNEIQNPFQTDYINVVAAGTLTYAKGFDLLIDSFKMVIEQNKKFRLYIIGRDDGEKKNLIHLVKSNDLDNHVFFPGFQTNPYKYFYHSDLYVLSSRWEGLPNTILENLYLKKPIVATRCIKFMDNLITDGQNGLIVDIENVSQLADAILKYKIIDVNKNTPLSYESDINKYFEELI